MSEALPPGTAVPSTKEEAITALGTRDAELRRLLVRALERAPVDAARAVLPTVLGDEDWRVRKEAILLTHAIADRADVVPVLVEALRAPSEAVALRNAAVEALAGLGASAVDAVERALCLRGEGALDADGRKLAIEVLGGARQPRSIPLVIETLRDPDPNVRAAAAEALGLIGGEEASLQLLRLLAGDDGFLRLIALEGLNRLLTPIPFELLERHLGDRIVRHAAIAALSRVDDPRALPPLVTALGDPSRHVGETALRALAAQLSDDPQRAPGVRGALIGISPRGRDRILASARSADVSAQRAALPLLGLLADGPAVEALLLALSNDALCDDAEAALATAGDRALDALIEAARRGDAATRVAAIRLLPRLLSEGNAAIEVLREGLRDPHPAVLAACAAAFGAALSLGAQASAGDVRALLRGAASSEPRVAAHSLQTLRALARMAPDAVRPHLADVEVTDEEAPVACALLSVMGGSEHVSWLSRALSAEAPRTRRAAIEALGEIGGAAAATAITFAITDEVKEVALAAIRSLGRARDVGGGEAPGVGPLLRLIESSEDIALVTAAIRALGQTEDDRAAKALEPLVASDIDPIACSALEALADLRVSGLSEVALSALGHPSSLVVRVALDVLESVAQEAEAGASPRVVVEVARALSHASWEVRRRAAELLVQLDPQAARSLLVARAGVETEPSVREAIDRGLSALGHRVGPTSRPPPRGERGEG